MATVSESEPPPMATKAIDPARRRARTGDDGPPAPSAPKGPAPIDLVEWDLRTAAIKDEKGRVLFEQVDCEIPRAWSQLATNVVVSKYFYGEINTPERETSVRQLVDRVSRTISDWGREDGYFASVRRTPTPSTTS